MDLLKIVSKCKMFKDGGGGTDKLIAARPEMFSLANICTCSSGKLNTKGQQMHFTSLKGGGRNESLEYKAFNSYLLSFLHTV